MREKLQRAFQPTRLDVINESHLHAGHRTSPGTGESHFRVRMVSPVFAGKSRLQRHRLVNEALAAELKGKGVEFTTEPYNIRPGIRICFIRGPQGISIELLERDAKYK